MWHQNLAGRVEGILVPIVNAGHQNIDLSDIILHFFSCSLDRVSVWEITPIRGYSRSASRGVVLPATRCHFLDGETLFPQSGCCRLDELEIVVQTNDGAAVPREFTRQRFTQWGSSTDYLLKITVQSSDLFVSRSKYLDTLI